MKFYYVYQLTNTVNGKIYIGCHQTTNLDDGYLGSGRRLAYAKRKYGLAAFVKTILSFHETLGEMLAKEGEIVDQKFLGRHDVYNLTLGGKSGWYHINNHPE